MWKNVALETNRENYAEVIEALHLRGFSWEDESFSLEDERSLLVMEKYGSESAFLIVERARKSCHLVSGEYPFNENYSVRRLSSVNLYLRRGDLRILLGE